MSNLDKYVEKVKKYIEEHPKMTETEIVRYVYIDLGKRFKFDLVLAFGNGKTKSKIYRDCIQKEKVEKSMENNIVTCRSSAYILTYILQKLGIQIMAVQDLEDQRKCKHVYNVVTPKEGKKYAIDLQQDLQNIQAHGRTKWFGVKPDIHEEKSVIPYFELEKIDRKIGYIDDENYYSDDYLYTMKADVGLFDKFNEKVDFVLSNIDIYDNKNKGYAERQLFHDDIIYKMFSEKERNKIHVVDCYYPRSENVEDREYHNCIVAEISGGIQIYMYSPEENQYCKISIEKFADMLKDGLVYMQGIPGLRSALKKLKDEKIENEKLK